MGAKGGNGLVRLTLEIERPSIVGSGDCPLASLNRDVILAHDGLAIEDEEGDSAVCLPTVQIAFDVCLDTGQATEGGQERFMIGRMVEKQLKVIRGVDSYGAIFELGDIGVPKGKSIRD